MLAWYERGGIVADAGLRGGGEFGREWHEAGRGPGKITTITDFIDCAEYLIAHGYTSARRLAAQGGSAGAIPVGGALVRRPDPFGAIVLEAPSVNKTRQSGAGSASEFGSPDTEDGLRDLFAIDCYQNVRDDTGIRSAWSLPVSMTRACRSAPRQDGGPAPGPPRQAAPSCSGSTPTPGTGTGPHAPSTTS